jgi:hypothetical protein
MLEDIFDYESNSCAKKKYFLKTCVRLIIFMSVHRTDLQQECKSVCSDKLLLSLEPSHWATIVDQGRHMLG